MTHKRLKWSVYLDDFYFLSYNLSYKGHLKQPNIPSAILK